MKLLSTPDMPIVGSLGSAGNRGRMATLLTNGRLYYDDGEKWMQLSRFLTEALTIYVCPAGQTTASYNGAAGVAVTPSDSNDGLTPTTPLATIAAAVAKVEGLVLLAPVTIQLADTDGGAANKVYFPSNVRISNICAGGITAGSLGVGTSDLTDASYPDGYIHIKGNETTPGNVDLIGAATYNGTSSSVAVGFRVMNSCLRVSGVDIRYFKFGVVASQSKIYAEKFTAISDNPSPTVIDASCFYGDHHSIIRVGGTGISWTNWIAVTCNGLSIFDPVTPAGFASFTYTSSGTERAFLMNEGSKGYFQGVTASFLGTGAYACFQAAASSKWNFNTDETTNITFNCANATAFSALWFSEIGAWTDASNLNVTVTALGKRTEAVMHSNIYVGDMAAGTSADTMTNGSAIGYSTTNWIGDGDIKYKQLTMEADNFFGVKMTRTANGQLQMYMNAGGSNAWESGVVNMERRGGTYASPAVVANGHYIFQLNGASWTQTSTYSAAGSLVLASEGASSSTQSPGQWLFYTTPTGALSSLQRLLISANGNIVVGTAALATNATNGFLYIPSAAGVPTGVPTSYTGRVPLVYDSSNQRLYAYTGGAWVQVGGGSGGISRTVTVTSGSATMGSAASTDYVYLVAGAHTMSLPAAAGNTNRYTVKNNHSANITVDTAGAENIEGAASISIAPGSSVDIISDGTNWWVI